MLRFYVMTLLNQSDVLAFLNVKHLIYLFFKNVEHFIF